MPKSPFLVRCMQSDIGVLAINWFFQAMLGMERKELYFRLLFQATTTLLLWSLLGFGYGALFISVIASHTINWTLNGQFWVCARYCAWYQGSRESLVRFMDEWFHKLEKQEWIEECLCIGSVGDRGLAISDRSDIDMRFVFPQGLKAWLKMNLLMLKLRSYSFFMKIPLDLYCYDSIKALEKFREDEGVLVISDRRGLLAEMYGGRFVSLKSIHFV